ncbi:early transcription factor [Squirrelpox virus]|uniref:Early transcription factor 82 kDa subunit n=1 Tax=Squirrelpox virus TaxID=240426 RepID=U3UBD6_9POXV|nr:early transcription factor [Squirrelpox virus]CCD83278.1 early transcription factor [Squirrelpox virus]
MLYVVNPQLVLFVGRGQEIQRALYLTPYGELDENSPLFYFMSRHINVTQPEVLRRHILVTLRMHQLKGYLCHLLGLDDDIIIYSHKNNLEYSYVDNTIFNPFAHTQKKTLIKTDGFLYNTYVDACDFLVIWVARARDTVVPEFGSFEEVDPNILKFEARLLEEFPHLDLNMTIETKFNNIFRTNLRTTGLREIVKRTQELEAGHGVLLSRTDEFFIIMTGNRFVINDEGMNLSVWDADGSLALSSDGVTITVNNVNLFTRLVSDLDPQMERIKGDITYKVLLETPITSKIKLDIETSFIFVETATNNILLSADKRISIILAKHHISVKVKNYIPNIEKYFTFLVIAINRMFNSVQKSSDFTKVETVYWSRICQNTKQKHRKPVIVSSTEEGMVRVSENFYRSDEREVFVNKNGVMFSCVDPNGKYMHLGFLSIFHRLQGICIPCCFLRDQSHNETFASCVHNRDVDRSAINPYVLNFGKVVTESKISFLPIIFDTFLNEGMQADFETDNKRLRSTTGYHVVRCCAGEGITRLRTTADIIRYVNEDKNILIVGDMVYYPMNAAEMGDRVRILIQEIVHEVIVVRKKANRDAIEFQPLSGGQLRSYFPYHARGEPIKSDSGLTLTTDNFLIDGVPFTQDLSTRFVTFTRNASTSGAIAKYFAPLFKYVVVESRERFVKTWVINTMMILGLSADSDPREVRAKLERYYPRSGRP